jgi:hypothetical protein
VLLSNNLKSARTDFSVELANRHRKEKPFVVSEFTNPSGAIVSRLYGGDQGRRIRKNFATRLEADAERK